jgi:hypothetical protein
VYNKPEHVMCCWQRVTTGPVPYVEKTWLEYGTDYEVSRIEAQDTGGMLYLLAAPPPGVQQLFIRRRTPRTQEVDLHNGARLTAELIESMGDKTTMEIQELSEQVLQKDDLNELRKVMNDAVVAEEDARKAEDQKLQEAIETEAAERKEADHGLLREIEAEALERRKADEVEAEARKAAVREESEARREADERLKETIDAEAEARKEEDEKLLHAVNIGIDEHIEEYFEENAYAFFEAHGAIPAGGTAGQILVKASDEDFDTRWADKPAGGGDGSGGEQGGGEEEGGNNGGEGEGNIEGQGGINLADLISEDANNALKLGGDEKLYVPESGNAGGGEGPAYPGMGGATFIIGNRLSGHTLNDVDYLYGNNPATLNVIIDEVQEKLPISGGKIIIREGKYNVDGTINIKKNNVILQGMGASTEIQMNIECPRIIMVNGNSCKIADLKLYTGVLKINSGIHVVGGGNTITGIIIDIWAGEASQNEFSGMHIAGGGNTITGNTIANLSGNSLPCYGIYITGGGNTITGNRIANEYYGTNDCYGICIAGVGNTITGNTIANKKNSTTNGNLSGIYIKADANIINENIISIDSYGITTPKYYGIHIFNGSYTTMMCNSVTITRNERSTSNTFALCAKNAHKYNIFHYNNLSGVTGGSGPGAAYTETDSTAKALPGSATTVAEWGTGGSCGFNIV